MTVAKGFDLLMVHPQRPIDFSDGGHELCEYPSCCESMLTEYIAAAMRHATYEIIGEDKSYYGEIPECRGVWANANTLEECRDELRSTLEDWILLRTRKQSEIPVIDGIDINLEVAA